MSIDLSFIFYAPFILIFVVFFILVVYAISSSIIETARFKKFAREKIPEEALIFHRFWICRKSRMAAFLGYVEGQKKPQNLFMSLDDIKYIGIDKYRKREAGSDDTVKYTVNYSVKIDFDNCFFMYDVEYSPALINGNNITNLSKMLAEIVSINPEINIVDCSKIKIGKQND